MTLEPIHSGGVWWLGNDSGDLIFPVSCKQQGEAFCELFNEETRKPLVAAAPDMLTALEGLLEHEDMEESCYSPGYWKILQSARAAIRKAKGKA